VKVVARHKFAPLVLLSDGSVIDTEDLEIVGTGTVSGPSWEFEPKMEIDPRWEEIARADVANLGVAERKISAGSRMFRAPSYVRDALREASVDSPLVDGKGLTLEELSSLCDQDGLPSAADHWLFGVLNKHEDNPDAEEEASLFSAAESELDWDEIDSAIDEGGLTAAASEDKISVGDTVQLTVPGDQLGGARDETPLECHGVVTDVEPDQISVRISEAPDGALEEPVTVVAEPANVSLVAAVEPPPGDFSKVVYLALIEEDDSKSVQDLVALVSSPNGAAAAFTYGDKGWEPNQELVTQLQSSAPPPIKQLEDWQTESITAQIRSTGELSKEARDKPWEQTVPDGAAHAQPENPNGPQEPVQASGFDVPESNIIWGPDNKQILAIILAAGGADRNRGNAETLRRYWTVGKGGAKIRWGTPGDARRCHRYLSKYLGPVRSWGYCNLRHKEMTGVYTGSRFNVGGNGR
jgi:hypothetical protein